jgi:tetratricopeptide (TPR) repeat protein
MADIVETLDRIASGPAPRGANWLTVCGQQIVEYCLSRRTEPAIDECIDVICDQLPFLPIAPASMVLLVDNLLGLSSEQAIREGDESTMHFCERARRHFVERISARIISLDQNDVADDDQVIPAEEVEADEENVEPSAAAARAPLLAAFEQAMDRDDRRMQEAAARDLGDLALSVGRPREAKSWLDKSSTMARAAQHWFGLVQDLRKLLQIVRSLEDDDAASQASAELDRLELQWGHVPSVGLSASYDRDAVEGAKAKLGMSSLSDDPQAQSTYDATACAEHYVQAQAFRQAGEFEQAIDAYRAALGPIVHLDSQLANQIDCLNGLGIAYRLLARTVLAANLKRALAERTANPEPPDDAMSFVYQSLRGAPLELGLKARACHRFAFENYKRVRKLSGQANQLSNLALVEELLGNTETAWHYQLWARQTHTRCDETQAAGIDAQHLQRIEAALCKE